MVTPSDTTTTDDKGLTEARLAPSRWIDVEDIPVIDMAPSLDGSREGLAQVARAVKAAAEGPGFFYVKNHGVPWDLVTTARAAARRFFAQSLEKKQEVKVNAHHRGFLAIGQAKMADYVQADQKESFVWGLEVSAEEAAAYPDNPFLTPNNWPSDMPELRAAAYDYFEAVLDCGRRLMKIFALGLDLPEDTFIQNWQRPIARGSVIYYPPQSDSREKDQFGVAPHTDYGCLTVLCQDDVGGLEVQTRDGEWVKAHPIEGTFVVNVGDLLARWSNNRFSSTPHRVVNRSGRERYSLVVAVDPDYETLVDPTVTLAPNTTPNDPAVLCGDYILQRFDKAFSYRKS